MEFTSVLRDDDMDRDRVLLVGCTGIPSVIFSTNLMYFKIKIEITNADNLNW